MRKQANKSTPPFPASSHDDRAGFSSCPGCSVRQETIEFLRDQLRVAQSQNDQLTNKLLALTGDAADRYQKLRVMELAATNAQGMSGILPSGTFSDNGDGGVGDEFDEFVHGLHSGLMKNSGGNG